MRPNERANDMYSLLNVLVEELNGLGLTQMKKSDVARKIIGLLPKGKYGTIVTMLHNENLSNATPSSVLGKITAHEMYMDFNFDEGSSSSKNKDLALKASMKKEKAKKKVIVEKSKAQDDDEDEESDNEEIALLVRRAANTLNRLGKKGIT